MNDLYDNTVIELWIYSSRLYNLALFCYYRVLETFLTLIDRFSTVDLEKSKKIEIHFGIFLLPSEHSLNVEMFGFCMASLFGGDAASFLSNKK